MKDEDEKRTNNYITTMCVARAKIHSEYMETCFDRDIHVWRHFVHNPAAIFFHKFRCIDLEWSVRID